MTHFDEEHVDKRPCPGGLHDLLIIAIFPHYIPMIVGVSIFSDSLTGAARLLSQPGKTGNACASRKEQGSEQALADPAGWKKPWS